MIISEAQPNRAVEHGWDLENVLRQYGKIGQLARFETAFVFLCEFSVCRGQGVGDDGLFARDCLVGFARIGLEVISLILQAG